MKDAVNVPQGTYCNARKKNMPEDLFKVLRAWFWFKYGNLCRTMSIKAAVRKIPDHQIGIEIGMLRMKIAMALLKERDRAYDYGHWLLKNLSHRGW